MADTNAGDKIIDKTFDVADPDVPIRLAVLGLAAAGRYERRELVRMAAPCHAFGGRADAEECNIVTRELVKQEKSAGTVDVDRDGRLQLTESGGAALEELAAQAEATGENLAGRVRKGVEGVVDRGQARIFADRTSALVRMLQRIGRNPITRGAARVYAAAFAWRVTEALQGEANEIAQSVRDRIDFFYTQAVLLENRERYAQNPKRIKREDIRWHTVRRGVAAARVETVLRRGPMYVNLLRIDPRKMRLRAVDATRLPDGGGSLPQLAKKFGALEATSGGFFLYSESDITPPARRGDPVGLLVEDGEVRVPPLFRRATLLMDADGRVHVRDVGLKGVTVRWGADETAGQLVLRTVNRARRARSEVPAFSRAFGAKTPASCGHTVTIVNREVVAVGSGETEIPLLGLVLDIPEESFAKSLVDSLPVGTAVTYELPSMPNEAPIQDAMAGGPLLLDAGRVVCDMELEEFLPGVPPVTFGGDSTVGQNLLPRLAWGVMPDYQLVAAAVDGRNLERSVGETLDGLARLMREIGCVYALNMDGGSSKRMCVDGELVDLSSTAIEEGHKPSGAVRPLSSALVLVPKASAKS